MNLKIFVTIIVITFLCSCVFDCSPYLNEQIKPLDIRGVVTEKIKSERGCLGDVVYKHGNKIDTLRNLCYCVPDDQKLWYYVIPGDSIIKQAGQLRTSIIRGNDIKSFKYPCCSR